MRQFKQLISEIDLILLYFKSHFELWTTSWDHNIVTQFVIRRLLCDGHVDNRIAYISRPTAFSFHYKKLWRSTLRINSMQWPEHNRRGTLQNGSSLNKRTSRDLEYFNWVRERTTLMSSQLNILIKSTNILLIIICTSVVS